MKRIGKLLGKAIEDDEVLRMARAKGPMERWPEIVGQSLAHRSWPDRYIKGVVYVAVEGSAWAQELRLMKERILERLRGMGGESSLFQDVRFGVRRLPEGRHPSERMVQEPGAPGQLTIREMAERRLETWRDES